jgi:transposase-like protein
MTPRKQMALKARTTCPLCESARIEPLNKSADGITRMNCRSCGHTFNVPTEVK